MVTLSELLVEAHLLASVTLKEVENPKPFFLCELWHFQSTFHWIICEPLTGQQTIVNDLLCLLKSFRRQFVRTTC